MIRLAAVAGSFYPAEPEQLQAEVNKLLKTDRPISPAKAIIVPHAGYVFSGAVAGEVIAATDIPPTVILLGPNHHGVGDQISVSTADTWQTPLGDVSVDTELRQLLLSKIKEMTLDERAHQYEHSLEVMLPLLLKRQPNLRIVPIALRALSLEACLALGEHIASVVQMFSQPVLLLASSDMNHFKDVETTLQLDQLAIDKMLRFDPAGLYLTVDQHQISMCGVLPTVVAMQAAANLGAGSCRLHQHTHSGIVNGDHNRVVGYAALSIV